MDADTAKKYFRKYDDVQSIQRKKENYLGPVVPLVHLEPLCG